MKKFLNNDWVKLAAIVLGMSLTAYGYVALVGSWIF